MMLARLQIAVSIWSVFCLGSNLDSAETPIHWLRGSGDDLEMRFQGTVAGAEDIENDPVIVTATLEGFVGKPLEKEELKAVVVGREFELWFPVNQFLVSSLEFRVVQRKTEKQARLSISAQQFRKTASEGIELHLDSIERHVKVKVINDGNPLSGANVNAFFASDNQSAITDDSGIATLPAYKDSGALMAIAAWSDDNQRLGGFATHAEPKQDPNLAEYVCELGPARRQVIRVINSDGKPVAALPFNLEVTTQPPNCVFPGQLPHRFLRTDESGQATHMCFPDWDHVHCQFNLRDPNWYCDGKLQWQDGVATQIVKRMPERVKVLGKLVGDAVAGLLVSHSSLQTPEDNRIDMPLRYSDANGYFTTSFLPNSTYMSYVSDGDWISDHKSWTPYSGGKCAAPIELSVGTGTKAIVIVTEGKKNNPVENAWVSFEASRRFAFIEDGRGRIGNIGRSISVQTDHDGKAVANVPAGKLNISTSSPWRIEKEIEVIAGEVAKVSLHHEIAEEQVVHGQAVSNESAVDLASALVVAGAIGGQSGERTVTTTDKHGRFEFKTRGIECGVYIETGDGKVAGFATSDNLGKTLLVELLPTASYRGRLINKLGEPIANHEIQVRIVIEREHRYGTAHSTRLDVKTIKTKTDQDGWYTFANLPARLSMLINTCTPHDANQWEILAKIYLEPGEDRPPLIARISDGRPEPPQPSTPLAEQFARVLRDCRLGNYQMMVILSGNSPAMDEFVQMNLLSSRKSDAIPRFYPLLVKIPNTLDSGDSEFIESMNWPSVSSSDVFVGIFDDDGREIGRTKLDIAYDNAESMAIELIEKHAPQPEDAQVKWDRAFTTARLSNRRVWVISSGRYCGPCFLFKRWIDDHKELLSRDYVFVKFDKTMDKNGAEVVEKITRGNSRGIPFHAIFDTSEILMIDSESRAGNIGMPSEHEAKKHLRKMLATTTRNLSLEQIALLVESIEN